MVNWGCKLQNHSSRRRQTGYVLALALLISFTLSIIGISLATVAASKYAKTKRDTYVTTANYVAEAGISTVLAQMYDDTSMTGGGYGPETTFFDSIETGKATYSVKVEPGPNSSSRYVSAIGRFYNPHNAPAPTSTQYIRVVANQNTSQSNYSIFAGPGGIELGAGAKLQAFSMYSGGKISLTGSNTQIGDYSNSSKIDVANVACRQAGSGSRFPYPCTDTDKPVLTNGNTIYGQVCASSQTDGTNILPTTGQANGLIQSCSPQRSVLNTIDRVGLLSTVSSTFAPADANCSNSSKTPLSGTYTGNVTITNCLYGFPRIMYIRGDLTITDSLAQSADANTDKGSIVIATGKITLSGSATGTNTANANTRFISFNSSDSTGCSIQTNCSSFPDTASGWSNTQASLGVDGIHLTNNGNLFGGEFTSYFGNISISGPLGSAVAVHSLAGQKLTISNGVTLASASSQAVSDLIQKRWILTNYTRTFAP